MSRKNAGARSPRKKKAKSRQTNARSMRNRLLIGLCAAVGVVLVVVLVVIPRLQDDSGSPPKRRSYSAPPPMIIDTSKQYTATIETEKGDLILELFAADVPMTVNNFVFLAREGFYDGTTFHRVIPGFVAQGGDPMGTGTGTPGYRFNDEITHHTHVAGALSMANSGPNTNGCQFFITYAPQHHLDGKHSVFGQLLQGMDVLESLEPGDVITRITIEER